MVLTRQEVILFLILRSFSVDLMHVITWMLVILFIRCNSCNIFGILMWRLVNWEGFVCWCPFVYCVFVYYCQYCLLSISLLCVRRFCGCGEPCGRAVTKGERNNLRYVQSFSISMCIHSQYFLSNNSLF